MSLKFLLLPQAVDQLQVSLTALVELKFHRLLFVLSYVRDVCTSTGTPFRLYEVGLGDA